jgi:hypothetical protein
LFARKKLNAGKKKGTGTLLDFCQRQRKNFSGVAPRLQIERVNGAKRLQLIFKKGDAHTHAIRQTFKFATFGRLS